MLSQSRNASLAFKTGTDSTMDSNNDSQGRQGAANPPCPYLFVSRLGLEPREVDGPPVDPGGGAGLEPRGLKAEPLCAARQVNGTSGCMQRYCCDPPYS
eukprot:scaffold145215_cov27-Prasinocladus_malaysianus.AAC.1